MRYRPRADLVQAVMVNQLRQMGFSVCVTSMVKNDFPDLVIGKYGLTGLVEAKSDKRTHHQKAGGVSAGQQDFKAAWRGSPVIVASDAQSVAEAFRDYARKIGLLKTL